MRQANVSNGSDGNAHAVQHSYLFEPLLAIQRVHLSRILRYLRQVAERFGMACPHEGCFVLVDACCLAVTWR